MIRASSFVRALLCVAVAALAVGVAEACPSCKAALAGDTAHQGDLVGGFFWSILFMLSMPFMVVGGMSSYFYYLVRQARPKADPPQAPRES